jgi:hypothetical protein
MFLRKKSEIASHKERSREQCAALENVIHLSILGHEESSTGNGEHRQLVKLFGCTSPPLALEASACNTFSPPYVASAGF